MEFTTADLCDAFAPALQLAEPLFRDYGGALRFAGAVETLRVFEDNALVREALEAPGRGRVLVVDGGGSLRSALIGGRLAALAHANGWSGLVVNGCIRDSTETRVIPIGIKALNTSPMRSGKSGAGDRDIAVRFAGITFSPGHFLYADQDGVVVADRSLVG
ncbi:MAG: ribonuclease E activity regulator RraA [Gemmatimonadales bacterium]